MKDWKNPFKKGASRDEMTAQMLEMLSRDNLKDFFNQFQKEFGDTLDFGRGYKFLDDEMDMFLSPELRGGTNTFNLFVEMYLKTGEMSRFLINTTCEMEEGVIKVGIADVPNDVYEGYKKAFDMQDDDDDEEYDGDDEEDDDGDAMMLRFLKTFGEKLKSGELKPMTDQTPNCTRCGRSDLPLTITFNASTMETQKICSVCLSKGGASGKAKPKKASVKELDEEIEGLEKLAKAYEELIKAQPEPDDLPPEIAKYAMTPMSNYKSIQALLAEARSERMKAMTSMKDETRLNYELKKALEAENYEESAKLRDKLKKVKK